MIILSTVIPYMLPDWTVYIGWNKRTTVFYCAKRTYAVYEVHSFCTSTLLLVRSVALWTSWELCHMCLNMCWYTVYLSVYPSPRSAFIGLMFYCQQHEQCIIRIQAQK